MPNWPVTTTSITEGTIIKASDLENNFNVLKNASNTLHERFSTLSLSCMVQNVIPQVYTSQASGGDVSVTHGLTSYVNQILQGSALTTGGALPSGGTVGDLTPTIEDLDAYTVYGVFQVPTWCQALRVRTIDVLNSSVLPTIDQTPGVLTAADASTQLEVGARYVAAISDWDQNASSAPGTSIASLAFAYSSGAAKGLSASFGTLPTVQQATPGKLVLAGQYIMVYGRGGITYTMGNSEQLGPTQYRFHVNMMCDAMVPIP